MIPIENSIAGRVADIHHLIPTSPLHIVAEHFLPIHFQLMVLPGTGIEALRSVHSHIHALGQCRRIIRRLGLKAVVAGDTAGRRPRGRGGRRPEPRPRWRPRSPPRSTASTSWSATSRTRRTTRPGSWCSPPEAEPVARRTPARR